MSDTRGDQAKNDHCVQSSVPGAQPFFIGSATAGSPRDDLNSTVELPLTRSKFDIGVAVPIAVGLANLELSPSSTTYEGTSTAFDGVRRAVASIAEISTPDEFRGTVAVLDWEGGAREVMLIDFHGGPTNYQRLSQSGRMTTKLTDDGTSVALLRAMKFGGRAWPTLNQATWTDLFAMLEGADPEALLVEHGAIRTGTYSELLPGVTRYKDAIAVEVDGDDSAALLVAFAMTRVLPIMHDFGAPGGLEPLV